MTAVVTVFNPRAEPRRAVKPWLPRGAGSVRLCRNLAAVERLLYQRLVDAVVLDVETAPTAALALPHGSPASRCRVCRPCGPATARCSPPATPRGSPASWSRGGPTRLRGKWIAARTAQVARREALADAPKLLRLTDRLQLAAWRRGAPPGRLSTQNRRCGGGAAG